MLDSNIQSATDHAALQHRLMRAQVFIRESLKSPGTEYAVACARLALFEVQMGFGGATTPAPEVLKEFRRFSHIICEMVGGQCVLCGDSE